MALPERTRRRIYRFVTGPRFPGIRLAAWIGQVPPAVLFTWLAESVRYLVFLSLAALIESALTDVIEAWKFADDMPPTMALDDTSG